MENDKNRNSPSLLEPESRGGDIADEGFVIQDKFILSRIPIWLSYEGFTSMIRESIGDCEAKFFTPRYGYQIELCQVKSYQLSPSEFWNEIDRFREKDAGSPNTFRWFTLASAGVSDSIKPLINGLRRIRNPYAFYERESGVITNSFNDYVEIVQKLGHDEDKAIFLFNKVLIEKIDNSASSDSESSFIKSLIENFPQYSDITISSLQNCHLNIARLVKNKKNIPITRKDLELTIDSILNSQSSLSQKSISIFTSNSKESASHTKQLEFDWAEFWGGDDRSYPSSEEWNKIVVLNLLETKKWLLQNRGSRRIHLNGKRRLSSSLAFGYVFPAVSGFSIDEEYRGAIWSTDAYPNSANITYELENQIISGSGSEIVVCVAIIRNIFPEVKNYFESTGFNDPTIISILGCEPITSPHQANYIVGMIKQLISENIVKTGSNKLHLFFAGPSFLALFLGHRLNATAPIQCYEWVSSNKYVPTCILN